MAQVLYEKDGRIGRITLNRPKVMNAINESMPHELAEAVLKADNDRDIHLMVLSGAGKAFCAGQDLAEATDPNGPDLESIVREHYNPIILKIRALENNKGANIKIITNSGNCTEEHYKKYIKVGANHMWGKPIPLKSIETDFYNLLLNII